MQNSTHCFAPIHLQPEQPLSLGEHIQIRAHHCRQHLYTAIVASLVLHAVFFLATSHAHLKFIRPTGHLQITLRLPSDQLALEHDREASALSRTAIGPERSHEASQPFPLAPNAEPASESSLPQIGAYLHRRELTVPTQPLSADDLPQPDQALDGSAELTLLVGESGSVDAVLTVRSSFPPDYLKQIEEFFSTMRFRPGTIDGVPQKSRFLIEISASRVPEVLESRSFTSDNQEPISASDKFVTDALPTNDR